MERENGQSYKRTQENALQQWDAHMSGRRRQQGFLSELLDRPVESLLMNQADHFRETQEERELLNQVMPLINTGYGNRVGSEFWSLPQRYGDDLSGIVSTLTQSEQGSQKTVTRVAQPRRIRQETGANAKESQRPATRSWAQSAYLQRKRQELQEVLRGKDIKKPDTGGLEVIGSSRPTTSVPVCRSPVQVEEMQEEEEERGGMEEDVTDPLARFDDVQSDALLIPALKFCNQLARWTGNSAIDQGKVGISATLFLEALSGESVSSPVELHNEGSTAIFYQWERLEVPRSLTKLRSYTRNTCFYFNHSSGVILPGERKRIEFIFKSEMPGIKSELWQLKTHPLLMQGASMQLTLRGVALYQDKTADKRLFIQSRLEKIVCVNVCQTIVDEVLQGIHTPERPSSPAEIYVTEEQEFLKKNPKLQYLYWQVTELKSMWEDVNSTEPWDLSVETLRQALLSLPPESLEVHLERLNCLFLQLTAPPEPIGALSVRAVGQQLWWRLLDMMDSEAVRLRNLLGFVDRGPLMDAKDESQASDIDVAETKEKKSEVKETRRRGRKQQDEAGKRARERRAAESAPVPDTTADDVNQQTSDAEDFEQRSSLYKTLLHKKVYARIENLLDDMCDLIDELSEGIEQDINAMNTGGAH
ncbi:MYCBP-associated protein isoform X2 [Nelusetta ayraudi]|uniref:MYCBP-associated protein isoform X2 n=1 Tax=Nelusetta ayraudi TaxID=303726 RepID=UPI003F725732